MSRPDATIPAGRCQCGHLARPDEVTRCRFCDCAHHVASPYGGHDPQTPPGAEAALQSFSDALNDAADKLAEARNAELEAEDARDAARRRWLLDPSCPPAGVFGGVRRTVAERDAWVEDKIAGEEHAYRLAKIARQAASTHLSKIRSQGSFQQSITKSVGDSYRGTGR